MKLDIHQAIYRRSDALLSDLLMPANGFGKHYFLTASVSFLPNALANLSHLTKQGAARVHIRFLSYALKCTAKTGLR
jgi:hypothetical protein